MVKNGGRKTGKKRKRQKTSKKTTNGLAIVRTNNGLSHCKVYGLVPDIMECQMTYAAQGRVTTTGVNSVVLRGNSIFDPDFGVGGGQPMGHDQYANFYRKYRVLASKVEAWISGSSTTTETALTIAPLNTNTSIVDSVQGDEFLYGVKSYLGQNGENANSYLSNYISTAKIKGIPQQAVTSELDYSASFGSNPNLGWYWHLIIYDARNSLGAGALTINYKVTYYVQLFDRETLSRS